MQHRVVKRNWARTNKNNALTQMTNLERRSSTLSAIRRRDPFQQIESVGKEKGKGGSKAKVDFRNREDRPPKTDPKAHYHIPKTHAKKYTISQLLAQNQNDPALPVRYCLAMTPCIPCLITLHITHRDFTIGFVTI